MTTLKASHAVDKAHAFHLVQHHLTHILPIAPSPRSEGSALHLLPQCYQHTTAMLSIEAFTAEGTICH
ncbi:hypothetical protein [Ktedonospora formicarum]|uniref:hypothetical protein n=1 Tax=Ktedonospora formicarum TaxID=2778364 RepID=UPI001C691A50|nr:hypothetical protein [Ktedonospora formicarum]